MIEGGVRGGPILTGRYNPGDEGYRRLSGSFEYGAFASAQVALLRIDAVRAQVRLHLPPVAVDVNWSTLERWWLRGHQRSFTSVSFLLDREGKIRGVHPGGRLSESEASYVAIRRGIERLLDE